MFELIQGYKDFFINKPQVLPRVVRGVFNRVVLRRPYLRVAEIATTFVCNSKCVMCSCSTFRDRKKEGLRMEVSDYESLGRQLDDLGCVSVNITGGEPLVRKDIPEIPPC